MSNSKHTIAVAKGDGIGPEIVDAVIDIFNAANVPLNYEYVDMGKKIYLAGNPSGMTAEAKETVEKLGILFKGPMETPKGEGVKSINVTARKLWNTFANVRKFRSLPGVKTIFSEAGIDVNMTILRENIEDTYGGIEYMPGEDSAISYRLITEGGCRQLARFTFEYAQREGISEVYCGHKANIMKLTDGLFMRVFYDVAKEYPHITAKDIIVDDLAMKLVRYPDMFKLVVLPNLQGDIISDLCAGLVGGLGFAPSGNMGKHISIFEAVHGTAPDIAGKKVANPTALLLSGLLMLRHLGLFKEANKIENALYYTLESGTHTGDFGDKSTEAVGTIGFAEEIIGNLGKKSARVKVTVPDKGQPLFEKPEKPEDHLMMQSGSGEGKIVGFDIYLDTAIQPLELANLLREKEPDSFKLTSLANRGTQVWPNFSKFTALVPLYRARFESNGNQNLEFNEILSVAGKIGESCSINNIVLLKEYNGKRGYSLSQGE